MEAIPPPDPRHAALLRRAEARQRCAARIAEDLGIEAGWTQFGTVHLVGAAAYGLIVAPDIDYEIFGHMAPKAGFDQCTRWATDPHVIKIKYLNGSATEDAGLGWQITYRNNGVGWNVQMWLLPADYAGPRAADLVPALSARLDTPARAAILSIKEALVSSRTGYRSIDVYRAVLDDGIDTPEQYASWCTRHATTGLLSWRPRPSGGAA
jgi:hypothetical protein